MSKSENDPNEETSRDGSVESSDLLAVLRWLDGVKKEVGEDCHYIEYAGIADKPKGAPNECDCTLYDEEWVDQKCGMSGDDYSGSIYVRKGSVWLRFYFSC